MTVTYHVGDSRAVIAGIPDGSVDLIASSPPFLALRSYLPAGHEAKGDEIGSEANPAAFLDTLLGLTAEWGRVLAPHGSLAIELGDTYSGSSEGGVKVPSDAGKQYKNYNAEITQYGKQMVIHSRGQTTPGGTGWPLAKSLALIPQLYAVALAYGINPLTGQPSPAGRWRVRNVIVWHRPNPAVGALGDKVRPSTSYIVVATRSAKRWFDLTAVRGAPSAPTSQSPSPKGLDMERLGEHGKGMPTVGTFHANGGAPPLDAWFDEPDSELRTPRRVAMRDHRRLPDPKPEPAMLTSYIVVATRSAKRWFDLTAVRTPFAAGANGGGSGHTDDGTGEAGGVRRIPDRLMTHAGAPPLDAWSDRHDSVVPLDSDDYHDMWTLTTQPSSLAHYAMWPAKLAERLVLMMCPREVCRVCQEPRRRVEGKAEYHGLSLNGRTAKKDSPYQTLRADSMSIPTLGWTDCGCQCLRCGGKGEVPRSWGQDDAPCPDHSPPFRPGITLDPFAGTGTTLAVADLHGRDAIGIDIDARNRDIYPARYDEVKRALYGTPPPMPGQEAFDFAI